MSLKDTIQQIQEAQVVAKSAYEAFDNLIVQMADSERIFVQYGVGVTVNRRVPQDPDLCGAINTVAILFCNTYLNVRLLTFLGEERGSKQCKICVTNLAAGYVKEYEYDFRGSMLIDADQNNSMQIFSVADAGKALAYWISEFIDCQKQGARSDTTVIKQGATTDWPTSPKIGEWWGGTHGFRIREQHVPLDNSNA